MSASLAAILRSGTLLLDAGMGTALRARGLGGRAPEWSLKRADIVKAVHREHVAAGAGLVLTNTFVGASPEEAAAALRLARESGAQFVGASLWVGLPGLAEQIRQLEAADCVWLESAVSDEQALRAVRIAVAATRLPVVITCAMRSASLQQLRDAGAAAAGYNCSPWPDDLKGADIAKPDSAGLDPGDWAKRVGPARLRGGCCGTDGRYLAALRATAR